MNRIKNTISLLLAVLMALTVCGGAFAETIPAKEIYSGTCGAEGDNLNWTFYTTNGVLSIKGTGDMADWFYGYYAPWYPYRSNINTVLIYSGVTSIGDYAFYACSSLASVTIPSNVTRIGDSAFYGCTSLASAAIGGSVTSIGDFAFYGCSSLASIEIPESVTSIGTAAFNGCGSLASALFLGAPPASFGSGVFDGCAPGFAVYYTEDHAAQWAPNGETEWNGCPIEQAVVTSGACGPFVNWEFNAVTGVLRLTGWGSMYDYEDSEAIPWRELRDDITSVVIEDGITEISPCAFADCVNMTSVTIPESVTQIGHSAFYNCQSLLSAELPSGITEIEYDTFCFCLSMEHVEIPEGVTYIGYQAFAECISLDGLVLPETLEIIDSRAFHDCSSLTSLFIPASVEYIGEQVFIGCFSLPGFEVDPENAVFCSYEGVLFYKDMTELIFCPAGKSGDYVVPAGVTTIREEAFYECSQLTSITLPEGLLTIGSCAFWDCDTLTYMLIPESVSVIDDYAFCSCDSLRFIVFLGGMNFIFSDYVLESCPADMLICYTSEYADTWNPEGTTTEWYGFPLSLACRITYTGAYVGTDYVPYGWDATLPVCGQEGMHYLFTCNGEPWWFGENVTEDVTVFVSTEANVHALFFFINNELYLQTTCPFGEEIVLPEYVPEEGYYFSGWQSDDGQSYEFMPDYDVWFYADLLPCEYVLHITYMYADGAVIDEVEYNCAYGQAYSITPPEIEGYAPDPEVIEGVITDDIWYYVYYNEIPVYTLTVHCLDKAYFSEGVIYEVCEPIVLTAEEGAPYTVELPEIEGYTTGMTAVSGILEGDADVYVMYIPDSYTFTVHFVFADGSPAFDDYVEEVLYGRIYFAEAPMIDGYWPYTNTISGYMPACDLTFTVVYNPLFIQGDVNGDGAFNFNDLSALSMYLLGTGDVAENCIPDFNGDGAVNYMDITDMYMALLG